MRDSEIRKHLIDARDEYIGIIKSEILGPGSEFNYPDIEHELISSNPLSRLPRCGWYCCWLLRLLH